MTTTEDQPLAVLLAYARLVDSYRRLSAALRAQVAEGERYRKALIRIRDMRLGERDPAGDGDTYILRGDEHVALRQIARAALQPEPEKT